MKKNFIILFLSASFLCINVAGNAQKAKVGATAGLTASNIFSKIDGKEVRGGNKTGYTFGLLVDAPLGKSRFCFQPGLHYVQKGEVVTNTSQLKNWIALRYAELQLNFVYNLKGEKGNLFIGLGPSLAAGLPSKKVSKIKDLKTESNIVFGNESGAEDFKGIDYGVNGLVGYKMRKGCFLSFDYTYGIRNLIPLNTGSDRTRNVSLAIRLGMLINNK